MRSSGEGRRGGGSGPGITAGRHSRVTFHLKKSRMSSLFGKKKVAREREKTSSCTIVRAEMWLALRFFLQSTDTKVQLKTSKLADTRAAGIGTNQLGELSHASKNATLHTCRLNLQRLHTNGLVSWDGERANWANAHLSAAFCFSALNRSAGQSSTSTMTWWPIPIRFTRDVRSLKTRNVYFVPLPLAHKTLDCSVNRAVCRGLEVIHDPLRQDTCRALSLVQG